MLNATIKVTLKSGNAYKIKYVARYRAILISQLDDTRKRPTAAASAEMETMQKLFNAIYDLGTPETEILQSYLVALSVAYADVEIMELEHCKSN